jgi:hypothetical protein
MLERTPPEVLPSNVGQVTRAVADIEVGERHRHDLGDLQSLATSIAENGLLHPIAITSENKLIAGARRLEACKVLGWSRVPVTVVDLVNIVTGSLAENIYRKAFTPSESVAIADAIEPLESGKARQRQGQRTDKLPGKFPRSESGRALDNLARAVGCDRKTLVKRREVVHAAESDPRFQPLVEAMDKTGKVNRYHSELKRALAEQASAPSTPPDARVIVGDWREQCHVIADNSVHLIFTDPPWEARFVPEYADLAKFAARVLVPGGSLVCNVGQHVLPYVLRLLMDQPQLTWWHPLTVLHSDARSGNALDKGVYITCKPLLWFVKGKSRATKRMVRDSFRSDPGNKTIDHPWAQGLDEAKYYIEPLTNKNSLVVDCYLGGGTTGVAAVQLGRRFVGFEIKPGNARKAEQRINRLLNPSRS